MDRFSGFWWAPDSRAIAYCAVDEGSVPPYAIVHQVRFFYMRVSMCVHACVNVLMPIMDKPPSSSPHHSPPPPKLIPTHHTTTQGLETAGEESVEVHRYPFAGGKNARVTLWVVRFEDLEGGLEGRWFEACRGETLPR